MSTIELNHKISGLHPILKAFTRRFTTDNDESLDLVQDTILKALMYKEKFKEDTNLKGWLFTIMRNTFINNYRKNQRAKTTRDNTKDLHFLNVKDNHTFTCPEATLEYQNILDHIDTLRAELSTPFKMHANGYKYHEIAEQLNLPIGTVKNRIFHARKEIQEKIAS